MIPIAKPYLTADESQAAYDTILSGWVTQGPKVAEFEEKFALYTGAKYAVAVSNCTTALHLSMIVAGIGKNDEVICPSMSYIATANSIKYAGGVPVFAEINPETYNLDLKDTEKKITSKTKAVLLVHQIGMPADIEAFKILCHKYNLHLIEDAACAAGSAYRGARVGSHSDLVCFSLHPRKVITTGEGGIITTNREDYYNRLKLLRQHGMSVNDRIRHEAGKANKIIFEDHLEVGFNYRMTDIQAAIGIKQLEKLDWILQERRKIAFSYHEAFKNIDCIRLPIEKEGYFSNYQSYSIFLKDNCPLERNDLMMRLLEAGIATKRGIMTIHRETAYLNDCNGVNLPATELTADRSLLIPLFLQMSKAEIQHIITSFLGLMSV